MPIKFFSLFFVLAFAAGCTGPNYSARAIKMQQSSGKAGHVTVGWFAVCDSTAHDDGATWKGPLEPEREQAMKDAADHIQQYPGHHVILEHH